MNLSPHFTLAELTVSEMAARKGIDNTPPDAVIARLKHAALGLEAIRIRLGAPIIVSSGYRSPDLNKAVGGSKTSAHMDGDAVDFICPGYGAPGAIVSALKDSGIAFDQLIEEFGRWVHVSFAPAMRGQVLRIDRLGTRPWM